MVFEPYMKTVAKKLPGKFFSFKPKELFRRPEKPDRFETQALKIQKGKATDKVSSIVPDLEHRIKVRAKERAENKARAEQLLVWDIVAEHAQRPAPTRQTIGYARQVLKSEEAGYLKWTGLRDQAYINRLQAWLRQAEESYTKNPEIRPTKPAVLAQIQKARTHLDYEDKILDGFEVDSDAGLWMKFLKYIQPEAQVPYNLDTIRIDRTQDNRLKSHLQEVANQLKTKPELHDLNQAFQDQSHSQTREKEVEILSHLLGIVDHSFSKLTGKESEQLSDQLKVALNKNNSFSKHFGTDARIGKLKLFSLSDENLQMINIVNPTVPLGTFLEAGAGVCRHQALWTKLLVDDLSQGGIKASIHYGWHKKQAHAWNQIRFPSGREYLLDTQADIRELSKPEGRQEAQKLYTQRTDTVWDTLGWPWETGKQLVSNTFEKMKALNPFIPQRPGRPLQDLARGKILENNSKKMVVF